MVSEGRCSGDAYLAEAEAIWRFSPNCSFNIAGSYIDIDTKGTLRQSHYLDDFLVGEADGIEDKVTSRYWMVNAVLKYSF